MTKKSFVAIAVGFKSRLVQLNDNEYLSFEAKEAARIAINDCALTFAHIAAQDNPRFDRARFLAACGF